MNRENMTCEPFEELISADLDNDLTAIESEQLSDHLSVCVSCQNLKREFQSLNGLVAGLGLATEPIADFEQKASGPLAGSGIAIRKSAARVAGGERFWWRAIPLGLAVALLVTICVVVWPTGSRVEAAEAISVPMLEVAKMNQQAELDQQLMVKMLEFELRSLRLELSQVAGDPELQMLLDQRLSELISRVKTFQTNMNPFVFGE